MSVQKRKFTVTVGDLFDGAIRHGLPYLRKKLTKFEPVEPYEFNEILKKELEYKREELLDPNALLRESEIQSLYKEFVEPDYDAESAAYLKYAHEQIRNNPLLNEFTSIPIPDYDDEERFINDMRDAKDEIDEVLTSILGGKSNDKKSYKALPLKSVDAYETDDEIHIDGMREIPYDEDYDLNPYLNNLDVNNQDETIILNEYVADVGNVDEYETDDDVSFTTMNDYKNAVGENFKRPTIDDYVNHDVNYYAKTYGIPLGILLGTGGVYYGIKKTYEWYKNRMNSGTDKNSKDHSNSNNESGANYEDKVKINGLINGKA